MPCYRAVRRGSITRKCRSAPSDAAESAGAVHIATALVSGTVLSTKGVDRMNRTSRVEVPAQPRLAHRRYQ